MPSPERDVTRTTFNPATNADLERAFADLARNPGMSTTTLREAICAYVDETKARGELPEQVIVGIKSIAFRAGVRPISPWFGELSLTVHDRALKRAVTWCIERYYDGKTSPTR